MKNEQIIRIIQEYCKDKIFHEVKVGNKSVVEYKPSWEQEMQKRQNPNPLSGNIRTNHTLKEIQNFISDISGGEILVEKALSEAKSGLRFDLYNPKERTAFEICLGAVKNEFERDVIKGLLDKEVITLYIFYREWLTKNNTIYGKRWFEQPAQKEIIDLVRNFKLAVIPVPLVPI